jgi:Zn-dependent M28 family amino/carboxypeptidase
MVGVIHSCMNNLQQVTIEEEDILPHILELSSDEFMGRMPFGPGDAMTVSYLVEECERIGLKPGNGEGYTQDVPMIEITTTSVEDITIETPSGEVSYTFGPDYIVLSQKTIDVTDIRDAELVFCGYGIVDEATGWNDFEGVDMEDKIAVVLVNDPGYGGDDPEFFKGDQMTYYGRWTYKYEEADRQGAKGLLIIHETSSAGYPWFVVQSSNTGPQLGLEKESVQSGADLKGWIHLDTAKDLFTKCGLDLSQLIQQARTPGFKPVLMNATLSTKLTNEFKRDVSRNVIGYVEGAVYPEEYIIYTAHWDHLGVGNPVEGDSIYNGAKDNATGTAAVLSIAEQFATGKAPDRSVVFLWVTAEEQGLLGSAYYTLNPLFPINKTVCNLNMDSVNPIGRTKDFQIVGLGYSEMDQISEEELAKQGRYVLPDLAPEKGYFFRSDHFNFAKVGIPPLNGTDGFDHWEYGKEYGKEKVDEYTASRYHAPSDEYDPELWDMQGIVLEAQLFYNIGARIANSTVWPQWSEGSEFQRQKSIAD